MCYLIKQYISIMSKRGGVREGAGRPRKSDEQKLMDKLSPLEPIALRKLEENLEKGNKWAVEMYFNYMYGKPKETRDVTVNAEQPLFTL